MESCFIQGKPDFLYSFLFNDPNSIRVLNFGKVYLISCSARIQRRPLLLHKECNEWKIHVHLSRRLRVTRDNKEKHLIEAPCRSSEDVLHCDITQEEGGNWRHEAKRNRRHQLSAPILQDFFRASENR